jgi:hypothetical protein
MDATIQIPPPSTGPLLDADQQTVSSNTVLRQRVKVSGAAADSDADVSTYSPASNAPGLIVRTILADLNGLQVSLSRVPNMLEATYTVPPSTTAPICDVPTSGTANRMYLLVITTTSATPIAVVLETALPTPLATLVLSAATPLVINWSNGISGAPNSQTQIVNPSSTDSVYLFVGWIDS